MSVLRIGRRAGVARRWLAPMLVVGLLLLVSLSAGSASVPPARAPVSWATHVPPTSLGVPPASPVGVPGSHPGSERYLDVPAMLLAAWQASHHHPALVPVLPVGGPSAATVRPPAPFPSTGNGTVTGRVYDITHGQPIPSVNVSVQPFSTTSCGTSGCNTTTTDSGGAFSVPAPAGAVTVVFSAPYYVANRTWVTVPLGGSVNLGILFLVHDGLVKGVMEDNFPTPSPIAGVNISTASRDGSVVGEPSTTSAADGSFTVAVPPLPSQVTFDSPGIPPRYLPNATFVNATPYETIDLGIVHLEGGINVTATLVDQLTGVPIATQTPVELQLCTRSAVLCGQAVLGQSGPHPWGFALPGPTYANVYALGYVANTTAVPDLPDASGPVDLGTIDMVPLAAIELSVNFTGGVAPSGPWPLPNITAFACSLDGVNAAYQITPPNSSFRSTPCWPRGTPLPPFLTSNVITVGTTTIIAAPPMRDALILEPIPTTTEGVFPYSLPLIHGTAPLFPGAYANITWVNASPDRVTQAGSLDIEAGTYVEGNVSLAGILGSPEGEFTVQVCSTTTVENCGTPVSSSDAELPIAGCAPSPSTFCAPSPPGPVVVVVTEIGPGYSNRTWLAVPGGCCGQDGHPIDIGWINITTPPYLGSLYGTAVAESGGPNSATVPIQGVLASVRACPVAPPPFGLPPLPCTEAGVTISNGSFNFTAPLGWDEVQVSATGYASNWTWIDVTGNNSTGVIELAPKAALVGQILSAAGGGVYSAIVNACPVGDITQCTFLGTTASDGRYNGSITGGPLPWGTYVIEASASGYADSWTWTNTSPGQVIQVPSVVLHPIGVGPVAPVLSAAVRPSVASVGAWVDGRIVDARTGYGVPFVQVNECAVVGGGCLGVNQVTEVGGNFNVSLLTGQYFLQFTGADSSPVNTYVNATSPVIHLGAIPMKAFPFVSGRILVHPWESLGDSVGLGAPVSLVGCDALYQICGTAMPTNTAGYFNVSVPAGNPAPVIVTGRGEGGFGSAVAGFDASTLSVTSVYPFVQLPTSGTAVPTVSIFGALVGTLVDGASFNATLGAATRPCDFCTLVATPVGSMLSSYVSTQLGAGGNFTIFLPSDASSTFLVGTGDAYWAANASIPGAVAAASLTAVPRLAPIHWGYVQVVARDVNTSAPLPYTYVTTTVSDPANATSWTSSSQARGDGFVNVTAPLGTAVTVNVQAPGYFNRSFTTTVLPLRTSGLGVVNLTGGAPSTGVFVMSSAVNTVTWSPATTVVDARSNLALPNALVTVTGAGGTSSAPPAYTNGLGQFLVVSPPSSTLTVGVAMVGYDRLTATFNTAGVSQVIVPPLRATGNGVVAGRIVAQPSGLPVYNLLVQVCPLSNPSCGQFSYTNASGVYWVAASAGIDAVVPVSDTYLSNYSSTRSVTVPTDGWVWVGTLPVFSFANILGTVRGLPSGDPLPTAVVSICSPFGTPVGPCDTFAPVNATGGFFIPSPPSTYIVQVAAPGYNTTYLPVILLAGENLSLGNVFLWQDGQLVGTVVSAINGAPIPNATLIACALYGTSLCSPFTPDLPDGSFTVTSPPGPVLLTASAPTAFDAYVTLVVPPGATYDVGPIPLTPLSANIPESIAGSVVASNRSNAPIPGAFVSASLQGTTIASTPTDSSGRFTLHVVWGTYVVTAGAPGYVSYRSTVVIHANLTGFTIALPTAVYPVTGTVRDAGSGQPIQGVGISLTGRLLATTGPNGTYALLLPNGTYDLSAATVLGAPLSYTSLSFTVIIGGSAQVRDLTLSRSLAVLSGVVIDANSGLPVPGALVTVAPAAGGSPVATQAVTATGAFSLSMGNGSYVVSVTAPGYVDYSAGVSVVVGGPAITILLTPIALGSGSGSAIPLVWVAGALVGAAIAAAGYVVWRRRQPPPPPPLPRWTLEDLQEPGVN